MRLTLGKACEVLYFILIFLCNLFEKSFILNGNFCRFYTAASASQYLFWAGEMLWDY